MNYDFNLKVFSFKRKISISAQLLQFGVIVATILLSVTVAFWGSAGSSRSLLALFGGIAVTFALIRLPNLGFLFLFLAGFVPFEGPGHVNASAVVIALLISLWLLDMLVVKRDFRFINSRVLLSVVVFIVISIIAFGMGQVPWFIFANQAPIDSQAGGFAIFVLSAGLLVLAAHRIQDMRWLKIIVWTFIAICTVYVLARAVKLPIIDQIYLYGFTAGSMFWTWLVALTLSQAIFNTHLKTRSRVLLFMIVLITFYVAFVQANSWKSGWVPPLICAAVLFGLRFKRLVVFVIPFALIAAALWGIQLVASDEYSWGTRIDAWIIVLEISKVNPLLGLGFANYYWYTPLFPIRGWFVNFNSHSQYVDLIAQVGVLGLLSFLWIFMETGRLGWRLTRQLPDGFARAYAYGVLAGVAGTLAAAFLVDWVLPFVYNIGFSGFRASILPWIFIGGLISVEQIYFGSTNPLPKEV